MFLAAHVLKYVSRSSLLAPTPVFGVFTTPSPARLRCRFDFVPARPWIIRIHECETRAKASGESAEVHCGGSCGRDGAHGGRYSLRKCTLRAGDSHPVAHSPWCSCRAGRRQVCLIEAPTAVFIHRHSCRKLTLAATPTSMHCLQCYTFGRNNHGQLGLAGVKETRSPRLVSGLSSGASRGAGGVGRHVIKVVLVLLT